MFREIRKKMVILSNRTPFPKEVKELFLEIQKKNWILLNMVLEGSQVSEEDIDNILSDNLVNLPVADYLMIRDLEELFEQMNASIAQARPLNADTLDRFYQAISHEEVGYRKFTPSILQWAYTPVPMNSIEILEQIRKITAMATEETFDYIQRALDIHNHIVKVMPYRAFNAIIARAAMFYYLMSKGLPIGQLKIKEEEYNEILHIELNKGWQNSALYNYLAKGTLETLNIFDNLTVDYR